MNGIDKKKHNDPAKQSGHGPKRKRYSMYFLLIFRKKKKEVEQNQ